MEENLVGYLPSEVIPDQRLIFEDEASSVILAVMFYWGGLIANGAEGDLGLWSVPHTPRDTRHHPPAIRLSSRRQPARPQLGKKYGYGERKGLP